MGAYQLHCIIITFSPEPAFLLHSGKNVAQENNAPLFGLYTFLMLTERKTGYIFFMIRNK